MNKCILIGNLTKDPDLKTTPDGLSVCNFTIAVQRNFKNGKGEYDADFIPVVVWRGQADSCAKYLNKGSKIAVIGRIQTRSYKAQDETMRYITELVSEEVKFLNTKPSGSSGATHDAHDAPPPAKEEAESYDVEDEDLPF